MMPDTPRLLTAAAVEFRADQPQTDDTRHLLYRLTDHRDHLAVTREWLTGTPDPAPLVAATRSTRDNHPAAAHLCALLAGVAYIAGDIPTARAAAFRALHIDHSNARADLLRVAIAVRIDPEAVRRGLTKSRPVNPRTGHQVAGSPPLPATATPPVLIDRVMSRLDGHPLLIAGVGLIVTGLLLGGPVLAVVTA